VVSAHGSVLTPTNMTIIIFVQNFYMEMYTYSTINWLVFHLIIERLQRRELTQSIRKF
jgi:hypothetical protein